MIPPTNAISLFLLGFQSRWLSEVFLPLRSNSWFSLMQGTPKVRFGPGVDQGESLPAQGSRRWRTPATLLLRGQLSCSEPCLGEKREKMTAGGQLEPLSSPSRCGDAAGNLRPPQPQCRSCLVRASSALLIPPGCSLLLLFEDTKKRAYHHSSSHPSALERNLIFLNSAKLFAPVAGSGIPVMYSLLSLST